jgi:hypothetical protein
MSRGPRPSPTAKVIARGLLLLLPLHFDPTWATFLGFGLVGFLTWGFVRVWGWLGALMWGREPACAHREDGVGRDCCADCLVEACW